MASQADNFISSTYWSDTVALAAGIATLKEIKSSPVIDTIRSAGESIITGLEKLSKKHNVKLEIQGHPFHFVINFKYRDISNKVVTLFMQEMVARGVYCTSSVYPCFMHTNEDVECIIAAADETFGIVAKCMSEDKVDSLLRCPERQVSFKRLV